MDNSQGRVHQRIVASRARTVPHSHRLRSKSLCTAQHVCLLVRQLWTDSLYKSWIGLVVEACLRLTVCMYIGTEFRAYPARRTSLSAHVDLFRRIWDNDFQRQPTIPLYLFQAWATASELGSQKGSCRVSRTVRATFYNVKWSPVRPSTLLVRTLQEASLLTVRFSNRLDGWTQRAWLPAEA